MAWNGLCDATYDGEVRNGLVPGHRLRTKLVSWRRLRGGSGEAPQATRLRGSTEGGSSYLSLWGSCPEDEVTENEDSNFLGPIFLEVLLSDVR